MPFAVAEDRPRGEAPLRAKCEALFAIDVRALVLFRVSLGVLVYLDLLMRVRNLRAHYTDAGVFLRAAAIENFGGQTGRWSLHLLGGSPAFEAVLFAVAGAFALMLLVGYRTRLATIASWVLLVSLQMRMPLILNGSDILLRMLWEGGTGPRRLITCLGLNRFAVDGRPTR